MRIGRGKRDYHRARDFPRRSRQRIQAKATKSKKRRDSLIVTELPFQVNKAAWIEKIAELVNAGRIEGIADLRDESDREGMRVVIEIKRDSQPSDVLEQLYRQTALQSNFGAIMLAIVEGQPRQLSLRQLLGGIPQISRSHPHSPVCQ